ncbi:hypothetical protein R1sor_017535 [Riccia sorocarpa]|uniref:Uncharacterized protein n=1 Tax=Riccia sorocarpa TaxID=122646 RepID=A0ABD3I755_9MARC
MLLEHAPEERSYADNVPESPSAGTDRVTDFALGHVRPYRPTLDEAIYKATWKLQFTMDEANVIADLHGRILKCLYDNSQLPTRLADGNMEYSSVNLGTLLWHAGAEWIGGDIGMRGMSSLESIMNTYRDAGMASTVRWRLCIGDEDSRHDAIPFGQSSQDEYIQSRGVRCICSDVPSFGLKRDCESCSERCTDNECCLMRKHMIPFDYLAIVGIIRNLCSCRTLCHSMLSMWRARERWISADRDPAPSFPIMEWWDETKAKEIAWFFDSHCEFELPVICQSCYEVYQAHPIKCEELSDEFNFSQDSQTYEFACSSCGDWICADRKTTKEDLRNIAIMGYWDGFQSSTTVLRSTWVVGIKFLNAGSNSKIPPMPVLFISNSTDESTSQLDILDAALEPFIRECVDLFVNGIHVDYAYPTELVDTSTSLSRSCSLHCMLVMFLGDHPAQCKFAWFSTGGLTRCRRCECLSRWKSRPGVGLEGIVEYHDNRKCYRYPPRARSIQQLQKAAMEIARCESAVQRKEVTRRSGVVA